MDCERNIDQLPLSLSLQPGMCPDWELNWQLFGPQVRRLALNPLSHASQGISFLFYIK